MKTKNLFRPSANCRQIHRSISHTKAGVAVFVSICFLAVLSSLSAQELPAQEDGFHTFKTADGKHTTVAKLAGFMVKGKLEPSVGIWSTNLKVVLLKKDGTKTKPLPIKFFNKKSQTLLKSLNKSLRKRAALLREQVTRAQTEEMLKDFEPLLSTKWDKSQIMLKDPFDAPAIAPFEKQSGREKKTHDVAALTRRIQVIDEYLGKAKSNSRSDNASKLAVMMVQFLADIEKLQSMTLDTLIAGSSKDKDLFDRYPMATVLANTMDVDPRVRFAYHDRPIKLTLLALGGASLSVGPCDWMGTEGVLATPGHQKVAVDGIYRYYLMNWPRTEWGREWMDSPGWPEKRHGPSYAWNIQLLERYPSENPGGVSCPVNDQQQQSLFGQCVATNGLWHHSSELFAKTLKLCIANSPGFDLSVWEQYREWTAQSMVVTNPHRRFLVREFTYKNPLGNGPFSMNTIRLVCPTRRYSQCMNF